MELTESVKIIEKMMAEGRKSINNYSSYFIVWGSIMMLAAIIEFFLIGKIINPWIVWPIAGGVGGILSSILGRKQKSNSAMDRIIGYTWLAFGISLIFAIFYSIHLETPPHAMILLLAAGATYISGGISGFKILILGGCFLLIAAFLSAFIVEPQFQSLVYAGGMLMGYLVPGIIIKKF